MPGVPKSTPSAFLPAQYASTAIGRTEENVRDREWDNLKVAGPGGSGARTQRRRLDLVQAMNREHLSRGGRDGAIEAEIQNMELAFRMQTEAPDLLSLAGEDEATRKLYGIGETRTDDFGGRACCPRFRRAGRAVHTGMHSRRQFGPVGPAKDLYEATETTPPRWTPDCGIAWRHEAARNARGHDGDVRQRVRQGLVFDSGRSAPNRNAAPQPHGFTCGSTARA